MHEVSIGLRILLGVVFLVVGMLKFFAKPPAEEFKHFGYPRWFLTVTGIVEVLGGGAMLVGLKYPVMATLAALWLAITMVVAVITHIRVKDPIKATMPSILFVVLTVVTAALNWGL